MSKNIDINKPASSDYNSRKNLIESLGGDYDDREVKKAAIPSSVGVPELVKEPLAEPIYEHLEAALDKLNIHYRCNCDVGEVHEFRAKGEANFSEWSEAQLLELKQNIIVERMTYKKTSTKKAGEVEVDLKFTTENFNQSVTVLMERNKAYPFREYIHNCMVEPFSDNITLENWLFDTLEVEDTPLNRWASKLIFLSVIQRVFEPGSEQRVTPFLIGKPGIGKSVTVAKLLPPEFRQYYSDNLSFSQNHKEKIEQTSDHLLIEIGELGGFSRADRNELKAYLTRQVDKVRLAYGRKVTKLPRKFALIGTANPNAVGIIKDDGLLDRILVLECRADKYLDMVRFLDDHRDHLWALAYEEYIMGTRVHDIPAELKSAQFKSSESMVHQDEYMNGLLDNLPYTQEQLKAGIKLADLAEKTGLIRRDKEGAVIPLSSHDQARLTQALYANGWERKKRKSIGWCWIKNNPG